MQKKIRFMAGFLLFCQLVFIINGCASTSGKVKDDVSVTGQTKRIEEAGQKYTGPQYMIGIITFENKTPSKVLAIGEAATSILRTQIESAGLKAMLLSEDELKNQGKVIELQKSGALKTGKKDASEGLESIDFRVSGAITAYSEAEEGSDLLLTSSKTQIARVTVDYALVDVASGRSLVAESGMGEYRKSTGKVLGLGSKASYDTNLRDGALRDALGKALEKMLNKLSSEPFQSKVSLVDNNVVLFRAGTKSNLPVGAKLAVFRTGMEIKDPDTGKVIGVRESKVGEITITNHQNKDLSEASIDSGTDIKAGDIVRQIK
ncbi:MAG: CsgG/HfaB family protein [bacterium]|nr:CsgG/HfaB family protein [bacterium]